MKTSLSHLPKARQEDLTRAVSIIRENCDDVEMVILFGSHARGDYDGRKPFGKIFRDAPHVSDYDILIVTGEMSTAFDSTLWDRIFKLCNAGKETMPFRFVKHDIKTLNSKLSEGQYFFSDIKKEGIMLYDSAKHKLADKGQIKPERQKEIMQKDFDEFFEMAEGFFELYQHSIGQHKNKLAAFNLHQACEHAYKSIHLVFTNYCPQEHFLARLAEAVLIFHPDLSLLFPIATKQQKHRFNLLEYAYIGARYDVNFWIEKDDLEILATDAKKLLKTTKEICRQKISS